MALDEVTVRGRRIRDPGGDFGSVWPGSRGGPPSREPGGARDNRPRDPPPPPPPDPEDELEEVDVTASRTASAPFFFGAYAQLQENLRAARATGTPAMVRAAERALLAAQAAANPTLAQMIANFGDIPPPKSPGAKLVASVTRAGRVVARVFSFPFAAALLATSATIDFFRGQSSVATQRWLDILRTGAPRPSPTFGPGRAPIPAPIAQPLDEVFVTAPRIRDQPRPLPFANPFASPFSSPFTGPMPRADVQPAPQPFAQPFTQPFLQPITTPAPRVDLLPQPRNATFSLPNLGFRPGLTPLQQPMPESKPQLRPRDCPPCRENKPKRKKKKPRMICYRGTYTEGPTKLYKRRKEQVPCQQSRKR